MTRGDASGVCASGGRTTNTICSSAKNRCTSSFLVVSGSIIGSSQICSWFHLADLWQCHPHQRVNAVPKRRKETDPRLHTRTGSTASTASSTHTVTSSKHTVTTDSTRDIIEDHSSGDCISSTSSIKPERVATSQTQSTLRNTSTPMTTVGTIFSSFVDA